MAQNEEEEGLPGQPLMNDEEEEEHPINIVNDDTPSGRIPLDLSRRVLSSDLVTAGWRYEEIFMPPKHYWVIKSPPFVPLGRNYHAMEDGILELINLNPFIRDRYSDDMIDNVRIVDAENHLKKLEL